MLAERAGKQAQQRAPALERLAHLVHGLGIAQFGVGNGPAGVGDNGARSSGESVAKTVTFPDCPRHSRFLPRFHDRFMKSGHLRPSHRRFPLLHSPRNARALTRASHFDAGWSSPVARQAHNLKVVGSNPTPATNFIYPTSGPLSP